MFCELITATMLCYTSPTFDATASVFETRFPTETVTFSMSRPLSPERVERRANNVAKRVQDVKRDEVDHVVTAAFVRPDTPKQRDLFDILFRRGTSTKIPAGIDINKPGYRAVYNAAKRHGVDTDLALRIARQESGGRCNARSHANAKGVMQVIPGTAKLHGVRSSDRLYDCKVGAEAGVKEIKRLHKMMGGDERKILIGYNCGPGCLKRTTLPRETTNYIARIMR